jgi:hypothetical protein
LINSNEKEHPKNGSFHYRKVENQNLLNFSKNKEKLLIKFQEIMKNETMFGNQNNGIYEEDSIWHPPRVNFE